MKRFGCLRFSRMIEALLSGGLFTLLLLFSLKVDNAFAASEQTAARKFRERKS